MSSNGLFAFDYGTGPMWMKSKSDFLCAEYEFVEPIKKIGEETLNGVEFAMPKDKWLLVGGPGCGILVEGTFIFAEAAAPTRWMPCNATLLDKVMVCPNWFGTLIKEETLFDGNTAVQLHNEAPNVAPLLNAYLYAHMHKSDKKFYSPDPSHPANGCPTKLIGGWRQADDSEWRAYGAHLFVEQKIRFLYKPLHNFMWFQGSNEFIDGQVSNALPMKLAGNLNYRINFHDQEKIFKRIQGPAAGTAATNKYMFRLEKIKLAITTAKLSPNFDRQISSKKLKLAFRGVTRMMIAENIPEGITSHRCRFQNILMPEGLLFFTVHKNVINGTWNYEKDGSDDGYVFGQHDIKEVHCTFNNQPFYFKSPNFGELYDPIIRAKMYQDYLTNPPLGMLQNEDLITYSRLSNLGQETPYPLVYMPLVNSDKSRIRTVKDEGEPQEKAHDFDIQLMFRTGAVSDVIYCIYAIYTDYNVVFDKGTFTSFYIKS